MYEHLKIEERGAIAIMTISAPKSLNALNSKILGEMDDYLTNFDCNKYRCLIVTGDGEKSFVAGADISEMATLNVPQGQTFGSRGAAVFRKLELPIAALVHSGGKSLHAIVRVDAKDAGQYRKRVEYLYEKLAEEGLEADRQNKNPSRLSRMPGPGRGGKRQRLLQALLTI